MFLKDKENYISQYLCINLSFYKLVNAYKDIDKKIKKEDLIKKILLYHNIENKNYYITKYQNLLDWNNKDIYKIVNERIVLLHIKHINWNYLSSHVNDLNLSDTFLLQYYKYIIWNKVSIKVNNKIIQLVGNNLKYNDIQYPFLPEHYIVKFIKSSCINREYFKSIVQYLTPKNAKRLKKIIFLYTDNFVCIKYTQKFEKITLLYITSLFNNGLINWELIANNIHGLSEQLEQKYKSLLIDYSTYCKKCSETFYINNIKLIEQSKKNIELIIRNNNISDTIKNNLIKKYNISDNKNKNNLDTIEYLLINNNY